MIKQYSLSLTLFLIAGFNLLTNVSTANSFDEAAVLNMLNERLGSFTDAACTKLPSPDPKPDDEKLRFNDFRQSVDFLKALSTYVYSFDREYLLEMAATIERSAHPDLISIFIMNALEPYFAQFGYSVIKNRYVTVALDNLKCLNQSFGITDLGSLKNIQVFQEAAVRFLASSYKTARTMMSENQKELSTEFVVFLGDSLAQGINEKTLSMIKSRLGDVQKLSLELASNPFLKSRATSEVRVINFLGD